MKPSLPLLALTMFVASVNVAAQSIDEGRQIYNRTCTTCHGPDGAVTIDPTNEYLISANQGGDNVVVFRIDHKTGHLTPTGSQQTVAQAGGVAFVKAQ